jgi:hypothetical protein
LINNEIAEITQKIEALDVLRDRLEQDLLKLQEEELELDDECTCLLHVLVFVSDFVCSGGCEGTHRIRGSREPTTECSAGIPSAHAELKAQERTSILTF